MNYFKYLLFALALPVYAFDKGPKVPPALRPDPFPKVTCANVVKEFEQLKTKVFDYNNTMASYMGDVQGTIDGWHRQLVNWEGTSVQIKAGEFNVIKQQVDEIGEVQQLVWDTLNIADSRFDEILSVLPSCMKESN